MTSSPTTEQLVPAAGDAGLRLDLFLAQRLPGLSRSQAQRLIRDGHVQCNDKPAKVSTPVSADMRVTVVLPPTIASSMVAEALPLSILFDDDDLAVIDKPAGMVVHPAAGHATGTLVHALLHHLKGLSGVGGTERPGIVHRLDRGTSGLMVIAKHDRAHRHLAAQFQDRTVMKEYVTLVWGEPENGLVMDRPIGRDPKDRKRMSTRAGRSRSALTTVVKVEPLVGVSFVRVRIGTGRTHQIRVHLSDAKHPIVGDALYGGVRRKLPPDLACIAHLERPFLHAARLAFAHPTTGETLAFEAPLPADLVAVLSTLQRVTASRSKVHLEAEQQEAERQAKESW